MSEPKLKVLPAARKELVTVSKEASLKYAETQMLLHNYSQLPVMTGERTVHGLISWKSIGRARVVGAARKRVADCMDHDVRVLSQDMSLLDAVEEIIRHEVVLVHDKSRAIVGIVTTTDLSMRLRDSARAFLLVGNIERQIRRIIGRRIPISTLRAFVSKESTRAVEGVEDLSFGEYLRVLQVPENWARLGLRVESTVVLKQLEEVRKIRNQVMHFRSDRSQAVDLDGLHRTESFLASLKPGQR